MALSSKTIGRIESLVTVAKMSATEHKMLLRIVEDAVTESQPAPVQDQMLMVPSDWPANYFEQFYSRYPNKKAPDRARKALDKVAKAGKTRFADLIAGLERYILSEDVQRGFVQHPATWINGGCWKNQEQSTPRRVERPKSFFDVAAESHERANGAGTDHDGPR